MEQGPDRAVGAEASVETWEDIETNSTTPVADELRQFADRVEQLEQATDDGDVSVYFTDDTTRATVTYNE